MKQEVDLLIVIPVGPTCKVEFIEDTIKSVYYYCNCTFRIILSDDSQKDTGEVFRQKYEKVFVLKQNKNHGKFGGLYITLALVYKYAIEHYSFKALLRMDTDALITGTDPQAKAIRLFQENTKIGMLGFHRAGKYSIDFMGTSIDNSWARTQILAFMCSWRFLRRPIANLRLRKIYIEATNNGYELGESIFGGACFISPSFIQDLLTNGYLPDIKLKRVILEEDHIFSMLARLLEYELIDLSMGDDPFGCAWAGLPASPETLYNMNKKIIHSTRYWLDMTEKDIRDFFKSKRI